MLDYMFKEVLIRKIETSAAMINVPSWKIMEKLGFHRTAEIKRLNIQCFLLMLIVIVMKYLGGLYKIVDYEFMFLQIKLC